MVSTIKSVKDHYGESGDLTITLVANTLDHDLSQKKRQETWRGMTASAIAEAIAKEGGLTPVVEPTKDTIAQRNQANLDDATFLRKLAVENGYHFYVQYNEMHFHPPNWKGPAQFHLDYFIDESGLLLVFDPKEDAQGAKEAAEETAVGHDLDNKTGIRHSANDANAGEVKNSTKTYMIDAGAGESSFKEQQTGGTTITAQGSGLSGSRKSDMQTEAESKREQKASEEITARATCKGVPSLCAKANITIGGDIGKKHIGTWWVKEITHRVDAGSGYTCDLELTRNSLGVGKLAADKAGTPQDAPGPSDKAKQPKESQYQVSA
jgi:phage protein D